MVALPITSLFAAALAVMMVPLTLAVSIRRMRVGQSMGGMNKAVFGDAGDEILRNRRRAFGNFIEYVPMCLFMIALIEVQGAPSTLVWWVGGIFVGGRALHALSMLFIPMVPPPRGVAMLVTYLALLIPAGWLLWHGCLS